MRTIILCAIALIIGWGAAQSDIAEPGRRFTADVADATRKALGIPFPVAELNFTTIQSWAESDAAGRLAVATQARDVCVTLHPTDCAAEWAALNAARHEYSALVTARQDACKTHGAPATPAPPSVLELHEHTITEFPDCTRWTLKRGAAVRLNDVPGLGLARHGSTVEPKP
jgi:hypothetical protein